MELAAELNYELPHQTRMDAERIERVDRLDPGSLVEEVDSLSDDQVDALLGQMMEEDGDH